MRRWFLAETAATLLTAAMSPAGALPLALGLHGDLAIDDRPDTESPAVGLPGHLSPDRGWADVNVLREVPPRQRLCVNPTGNSSRASPARTSGDL